tara:strand:+ start:3131 stop:3949 length:819 start_codon:yes stop_codon:yes gene_type:complete
MVNSTGIMGQLDNGSPSIGNAVTTSLLGNHTEGTPGTGDFYTNMKPGANPYTTAMQLPEQPSPMQPSPIMGPGSDTLANLADLMGNNPGFPGFNEIDGMIGPRLQPHNNINFDPTTAGLLPPPQAVGGGMQPSTPGFDTDAFSTSILSGVGDLFQEYMGPQQETMPGALPMPFMPGGPTPPLSGPSSGQPPLMDTGFMPDGSPGYDPFDLQIRQREILQQYEGNTPSIQPDAYGFDGPTTGTGTLQEKQLANDGMNTNYNNASGIQSAFRGF